MNRLQISPILFTLLLLLAGCSKSGSDDRGDPNGSARPGNKVAAEVPAPLQPAGTTFVYNFDNDPLGQIPSKFHEALTGQGARPQWVIEADQSAPSQPNVLAQVSNDKTDYRFPVAISDEGSYRDLDLSVKFKAISGSRDQAAGVVWRLKDRDNYYIVRANALENNVVLYKVENGKRSDLDIRGEGDTYGRKARVPKQQWNTLRVVVVGNLFEVYLDDEKLFEVEDETFKDAGKVGLWTKADSITYFDDLRITAK